MDHEVPQPDHSWGPIWLIAWRVYRGCCHRCMPADSASNDLIGRPWLTLTAVSGPSSLPHGDGFEMLFPPYAVFGCMHLGSSDIHPVKFWLPALFAVSSHDGNACSTRLGYRVLMIPSPILCLPLVLPAADSIDDLYARFGAGYSTSSPADFTLTGANESVLIRQILQTFEPSLSLTAGISSCQLSVGPPERHDSAVPWSSSVKVIAGSGALSRVRQHCFRDGKFNRCSWIWTPSSPPRPTTGGGFFLLIRTTDRSRAFSGWMDGEPSFFRWWDAVRAWIRSSSRS